MNLNRLEAFSDGVLAIIITIMVLELKVPHGTDLAALKPVVPVLLCYVLSFVYVGIYWNNHHHLIKASRHVSPGLMWANLHFLFWISLLPFVTGWMGQNSFAALPTAVYAGVLMVTGVAYYILQGRVLAMHGPGSKLAQEFGRDWKGKLSVVLYAVAIPTAFASTVAANAIFVGIALWWLVPDRRLARHVAE